MAHMQEFLCSYMLAACRLSRAPAVGGSVSVARDQVVISLTDQLINNLLFNFFFLCVCACGRLVVLGFGTDEQCT
jgi:hypothetical protein